MDTQSVKENYEAIGEPGLGEEPARGALSQASCAPNGDAKGGLEAQSDQGRSGDPSLGEKLQTEEGDQRAASKEGTCSLLGLSFPRKLWAIAESEAFKSVGWSEGGDSVKIEICHNANFQRDKPRLLDNILRRRGRRSPAQEEPCCKRRKLICLRRSPRLQKKEENAISPKQAPDDWAPRGQDTFIPPAVAGCLLPVCPPQEHSVPCAECSSEDGTTVSTASDNAEGSGQVSITCSQCPAWGSVKSFYNKCCSTLKAAVSAMSLSELSDGEREEGSPSESSDEEEQEGAHHIQPMQGSDGASDGFGEKNMHSELHGVSPS
uniref:heat shock transcription factor, X-linked member 3-like n=1 Tax=Jaculus jaculus TaxID=51337 RepID=UPI001E1B173F|nr:heat shock transcription factor, X-linked member 3-like [Jaculus jaculus]